MDLSTGNTYTVADTMTLTVPADAAPGDYLLKIVASASADYMGLTYNEKPVIEYACCQGTRASRARRNGHSDAGPDRRLRRLPASGSTVPRSRLPAAATSTYKSGDVSGTTSSGSSTGSVGVNLTHVPDGSLTYAHPGETGPGRRHPVHAGRRQLRQRHQDIACVLVVDHPTLANGADISSATITMTVSKAWVDAHGGISAIKILRYSDGVGEALETTCTNPGGDPLIFQAFSPHGLSEFALAAVAQLPVTAAESAPVGVQVGASIIIGIIAVIIILLVAIIGVVYVVRKRG